MPAAAWSAPDGSAVELRIANAGGDAVVGLRVAARLGGGLAEARVERLAAGAAGSVRLAFPRPPRRPGRHALTLELEYRPEQPDDAPRQLERAALLLALEADPEPAVALRAPAVALDLEAALPVELRSLDGAAHGVALEAVPAAGFNVLDAPDEVVVPARGSVTVPLRLLRGGAARGASHRLQLVARVLDGERERAVLAETAVSVLPDPARLARLRSALAAAGLLLLLGAGAAEWARRRPPRA